MQKIPISIISGMLGAGKTTLLRRIIKNLDRKFAILMNEFGDVGIDTEIIKGKNINVAELLGGCVCCSLAGEFEEAIREIIQNYNPEIIIVETTGVAESDAIVLDITENLPQVKIDSVIAIADADAIIKFPSIGRTAIAQLGVADIIIINKIDLINKKQLKKVKERIKEYNKKALLLEAEHCNIDINLLFDIQTEREIEKLEHRHDNKFQFFTYKIKNKLSKEKLESFLKKLPSEFYRLKGFVPLEDNTYLLSYVAGQYTLEKFDSKSHELVFIGENINKVKEKIIKDLDNL